MRPAACASQGGGAGSSSAAGGGEEEDSIAVQGSYGSKVCTACVAFIHVPPTARQPPLLPACTPTRLPAPPSPAPQLEAVVRRLLWLTRWDATARVLVFSTWKDVLELIRWGRVRYLGPQCSPCALVVIALRWAAAACRLPPLSLPCVPLPGFLPFLVHHSNSSALLSTASCSHALSANGLPHLYPRSSKKFEAAVAEFRSGHEAAMKAAAQAG